MTSEVRDKRTYTLAEFTRLPDNGKRYELVKGKLVEMAQPGDLHGRVGSKLLTRLADFVEDHKLGLIYIPTKTTIAEHDGVDNGRPQIGPNLHSYWLRVGKQQSQEVYRACARCSFSANQPRTSRSPGRCFAYPARFSP